MLSFLSTFSSSFLLALLVWPVLAALLTLPILVLQYRKFNKLSFWRAVFTYAFILYLLGLVSFTLYPMPDNPAVFCRDYHLSPQLNPLQFMSDIQTDGLRAVLQIVMNVVFFVPLGVFARLLFGWKLLPTIGVSLLASFAIETAQLTGAFGLYPCSYRLFDVDDLAINTLGGLVGYTLACLVPKREIERADKQDYVKNPGLLRQIVALAVDQIAAISLYIFVILLVYVTLGSDVSTSSYTWIYAGVLVLIHLVIPFIAKGWSLGSRLVRFTHDDRSRRFWHRVAFYLLRSAYLFLLLFMAQQDSLTALFIIIATLFTWIRWKKLPYQLW